MPKLFASSTYEEKKSKFLAFAYILDNENDNKDILVSLKKEHEDARHLLHVCRFKNKFDACVLEASDDREPISSMKKEPRTSLCPSSFRPWTSYIRVAVVVV